MVDFGGLLRQAGFVATGGARPEEAPEPRALTRRQEDLLWRRPNGGTLNTDGLEGQQDAATIDGLRVITDADQILQQPIVSLTELSEGGRSFVLRNPDGTPIPALQRVLKHSDLTANDVERLAARESAMVDESLEARDRRDKLFARLRVLDPESGLLERLGERRDLERERLTELETSQRKLTDSRDQFNELAVLRSIANPTPAEERRRDRLEREASVDDIGPVNDQIARQQKEIDNVRGTVAFTEREIVSATERQAGRSVLQQTQIQMLTAQISKEQETISRIEVRLPRLSNVIRRDSVGAYIHDVAVDQTSETRSSRYTGSSAAGNMAVQAFAEQLGGNGVLTVTTNMPALALRLSGGPGALALSSPDIPVLHRRDVDYPASISSVMQGGDQLVLSESRPVPAAILGGSDIASVDLTLAPGNTLDLSGVTRSNILSAATREYSEATINVSGGARVVLGRRSEAAEFAVTIANDGTQPAIISIPGEQAVTADQIKQDQKELILNLQGRVTVLAEPSRGRFGFAGPADPATNLDLEIRGRDGRTSRLALVRNGYNQFESPEALAAAIERERHALGMGPELAPPPHLESAPPPRPVPSRER